LFFQFENLEKLKVKQNRIMAEVIRMPRMSDTMEEGVIVSWLKKEGDAVEPGDLLAEVETDKATMELESYTEGVLLHIGVKSGAVPVNGIIAVIGEKGEDYKEALKAAGESSNGKPEKSEEKAEAKSDEKAEAKDDKPDDVKAEKETEDKSAKKTEAGDESEKASESSDSGDRLKASPLAKSMAKEAGVEIKMVKGTGEAGRIVKRDVQSYIDQQGATPDTDAKAPAAIGQLMSAGEDKYTEETVSQMRKTIARRLGESKFSAPHFYLTIDIDMAKAMDARKAINAMADVKISFNDLVIKAAAAALQQHPAVNSSWLGDKIRRNQHIHMGVAVAVSEGLLVPVIRNANFKTLSQLNNEVRELAEKAKAKKLKPEEMQGNTFTISNLGMFGIEEFTAIINPPDACILAVGAIVTKPVVNNGQIVIGHRMKVTLSCDHRVVDGATGAAFLQTFKLILEDPIRMLV